MSVKKKHIDKYELPTGRFWFSFIALSFVGLGILWRIVAIQTIEHDHWTERGVEFEHSIRTIVPARGQIQARDGSLLATSIPVYDLRWDSKSEAINKEHFSEKRDSICLRFAEILGGTPEKYQSIIDKAIERGSRSAKFASKVPFTDYKELKSIPFVKEGRNKSGFVFERKEVRRKPFGQLAGRTIGIDRESQRVGIELSWNQELGGTEGKQMQKRINGGAWLPVTDDFIVQPQEEQDVITTIDMHLQDMASSALKTQLVRHDAEWGVVVLMEVKTGYVRAITNLKRFENAEGIANYYESYNHALGKAIEPGSTFKLASLITCLESGKIAITDSINTGNGVAFFHDRRMRDSTSPER